MNTLVNFSFFSDILHSSSPFLKVVLMMSAVFLLGLFAQILADKTHLPAIIFLLAFGSLLGNFGLGLINPDIFGPQGLRAIIAVAVAIVVFEGGLTIDFRFFRQNWSSVLGLVTLNVVITIFGMAWITYYLVGIPWKIALLYASLVSVTGPTVIAPVLRRLHVSHKVKVILETEAVVVDAIGVIAAVSIFNYVKVTELNTAEANTLTIFQDLGISLLLGALSGIICAWGARLLVDRFAPLRGEVTRMLVLVTALSAYSLGELLAHESGIAAVAVAGFMIGNMDFPHKSSIKAFKGDLTLMSITVVFLLLAASLDLQFLARIGFKGALCVLALMFVVRPLGVILSTWFEKISWGERIFIAGLGPRGIVAASAATFFALELDSAGIEGANAIRGLVFMTVLMTVIIQGSGARFMANLLNISPKSVLIIGGGTIGKQLIYHLKDQSSQGIVVIENNPAKVERLSHLAHEGVYVISADARRESVYRNQLNGVDNISTVIATSDDDWVNLRVCQILKKMKPRIQAISIIHDVKGRDVFENLDIQTINLREAAANLISVLLKNGQKPVSVVTDTPISEINAPDSPAAS
ncbi:MAG: cation:proton antiporter [Candidatus Sericytochromatia bacterium]|nr:cation:proton antiporter [Candidatus Sericytochromatia bacterium]